MGRQGEGEENRERGEERKQEEKEYLCYENAVN